MADLFHVQADKYAEARPTYPPELFEFIASKTPQHLLAWDVGTGNGQAAVPLSKLFENVVATDSSEQQLSFAPKLPNIRYRHLPSTASTDDIQLHVGPQGSVDLITVAQALHWFDLPVFYDRVRFALRPHRGVLAAWCYTEPRVNEHVDVLFDRFYTELAGPFWAPERKIVDDEYKSIEFPFDPVEGMEGSTGPVEFAGEREMDLDRYFTYLRSWSAYQTAKKRGFELLSDDLLAAFERAWGGDRKIVKVVRYPIFLRIGKVRE